jgi:hypothetical protein
MAQNAGAKKNEFFLLFLLTIQAATAKTARNGQGTAKRALCM